jgi:anti-sigma B factor antagonist
MAVACVSISERDGVHLVEFAPDTELDSSNIEQVQERLYALVEGGPPRKVLLDFLNVGYAASQALGSLVTLRLKAARTGSTVVLARIPETLMEIVRLTQIDKLYEVFPTLEAALARLR